MKIRIVGVASANGLGHVLRILRLLKGFSQLDMKTALVCSRRQIELIKRGTFSKELPALFEQEPIGLDGPSVLSISNQPSKEVMKLLNSATLVISDNLLWPIEFSKRFALCANFLWQNYWHKLNKDDLIERIRVDIGLLNQAQFICDYEYFSQISNISGLRIKVPYDLENPDGFKLVNETWISSGTIKKNNDIYELLKNFKNIGMIRRSETNEISRLRIKPKLVIGRPGIGTISDCIAHEVPFIPFLNSRDMELEFNQEILAKNKLIDRNLLPRPGYLYSDANMVEQAFYVLHQKNRIINTKKKMLSNPMSVAQSIYNYCMNDERKR